MQKAEEAINIRYRSMVALMTPMRPRRVSVPTANYADKSAGQVREAGAEAAIPLYHRTWEGNGGRTWARTKDPL